MTDKARELLKQACNYIDSLGGDSKSYRIELAHPEVKPQPFNQAEFDEMVRKGTEAWKDYKPEQDDEPIGYVYSEYGSPRKNVALSNDSIPNGTPVYLHPAPRNRRG